MLMAETIPANPNQVLDVLHTRIYDKRNKRYGWKPHSGQVRVGKALFVDGKKKIFIQCGRKWGKTEFVIYTLLRWAVMNPGCTCAYFGDKRVNARKIIWRRLKTFIPKEFLLEGSMERGFKEQTLEVRLWNGSEIVVDGTVDEDSGRGVEPHLVVYDEYKDHNPDFHKGMEPNLEVHKAIIMFIGTAPDHENHFTEMAEEVKNDPEGFYIEAPSEEGPVYGSPEGLDRLKKLEARHQLRGDYAGFLREYKGKFVLGGAGAIFPMWNRTKHTVSDSNLKEEIRKNGGKLEWYVITDPGTTSCHASLLAALNPYNKVWYILEEIYEKNPEQTSTRRMWPRIEGLMKKWNPSKPISDPSWYKGYDEAGAWFANEVSDSYPGVGLSPTNKKLHDKESGLSLIKDQMIENRIIINSECVWMIWEIERYVKDKNNNIPKKNDHLIDIMRYLNSAAGFRFDPEQAVKDRHEEAGWRATRPSDEYDIDEFFD